jgi:hypothetical protein
MTRTGALAVARAYLERLRERSAALVHANLAPPMRRAPVLPCLLALVLHPACKRDPASSPTHGAAESRYAVGQNPNDVVLIDVDGDARLDAITASPKSRELHLLRGDGRGGFSQAVAISTTTPFHAVAAADVDADGDADLLATQHDAHGIDVLLNDGNGRLTPSPHSPVAVRVGGQPHNHGLVVADFDEDGKPDALTSDQDAGSVALALGDGRGGFAIAPGSPWPVGRDPYPPAVADLNGDGHLDVASPLVAASAVAVLLGDGRGGFAAAKGAPGPIAPRPYSLALGDVTGDGRVDAVVAHDDASTATLLAGDGAGGLSSAGTIELGGRGFDVALVDMDADAVLDIVVTKAPDAIAVLLGEGRGGFAPAPGSPYVAGNGPTALATGDLDGNGALDIVAVSFESNDLAVLLR